MAHYSTEREALIQRSVTEMWTLQELGDALGITREGARLLLKARGLDKLRIRWRRKAAAEKPVRWCSECQMVITAPLRRTYCSKACYTVRVRRTAKVVNRERYRSDPALRAYRKNYQKAHPEVDKMAGIRFRQTLRYQSDAYRLRRNADARKRYAAKKSALTAEEPRD